MKYVFVLSVQIYIQFRVLKKVTEQGETSFYKIFRILREKVSYELFSRTKLMD